ncbi:unnamed protein product [Linum tenue]|uniref:Uncharacterized protein n=1 Tax=Linum tenue TaxID=586396 RepID=A0AAV0Q0F1_9ROSI|nr:unnamed protein product [Linum tenue]CAI0476916.1 unnamed protein product [Linum tenue]
MMWRLFFQFIRCKTLCLASDCLKLCKWNSLLDACKLRMEM